MKKTTLINGLLVSGISALLLLPACSGGSSSGGVVKVATPAADDDDDEEEAAPKPEPVVKKPLYTYNPIGKRDPFRTYLALEDENSRQPVDKQSERRKTPLEKFTLDQLRLTAIISGTSSPMAMVEDPENKGWTVHVGTRIGNNGGKVSAILRDGLVITEEYRDAAGRKRTNKVNLSMPVDAINLGQ